MIWMLHDGFRPLTGINFNPDTRSPLRRRANSFRPLTGINFNELLDEMISYLKKVSVPSRG